MKYTRNILIVLTVALLFVACQRGSAKPDASTGDAQAPAEEKKITVPVMVQEIELRDLPAYVNVTGTLEGVVDITMSSETSGRIVELHKKLGDWVAEGEAIGRVDNESQRIQVDQAEAGLMAAEAAYEAAQRNWQASQELFSREAISEYEFTQSKSAMKSAQASLAGAQSSLELARDAYDNSRFVAPVSGYITTLPIEVGETINMGQVVCGIVNPRRLVIKTGVGESHIASIGKGEPVRIEHPSLDEPVEGRITGVGIKPLNGASYPIEIALDNKDEKLMPGMVIDGRIQSELHEDVIFIPKGSVVEGYTGDYVYLVNDDFTASRRKVVLGNVVGSQVLIKSGLDTGDKLVTEGMDNLQEGVNVVIRQAVN